MDDVTCFSNVSSQIEILAPGAFMDTSALGGGTAVGLAGTSFASPLVAGCAALVKAARPSTSAPQIRADLLRSPTMVTDERVNTAFPRLDCYFSLEGVFFDDFEVLDP